MKLSAGEIDAIIAGCENVTPGPWSNSRNASDIGNIVDFGVPPKAPFMCLYGVSHSDGSKVELEANAAHIARLDPATVLALAQLALDGIRMRKALETARNDIDLISDVGNVNPDFAFAKIDRALNPETHSGTDK